MQSHLLSHRAYSHNIYVCVVILFAAKLLLLARKQRVHGRVELIAALEEVEFEDENVLCDLAAELLDEGTSRGSGATCLN